MDLTGHLVELARWEIRFRGGHGDLRKRTEGKLNKTKETVVRARA